MKKKIFLVLGLIVFAILAAGSVGGTQKQEKGMLMLQDLIQHQQQKRKHTTFQK